MNILDMVHIYNRMLLNHKKECSDAFCSNMAGPGDHHKWCKSHRERQMLYDIIYMQNLEKKMVQVNLFTRQKQTHRLLKQTYGYQVGRVGVRDSLGVWDWHVHTAVIKVDNQWGAIR